VQAWCARRVGSATEKGCEVGWCGAGWGNKNGMGNFLERERTIGWPLRVAPVWKSDGAVFSTVPSFSTCFSFSFFWDSTRDAGALLRKQIQAQGDKRAKNGSTHRSTRKSIRIRDEFVARYCSKRRWHTNRDEWGAGSEAANAPPLRECAVFNKKRDRVIGVEKARKVRKRATKGQTALRTSAATEGRYTNS